MEPHALYVEDYVPTAPPGLGGEAGTVAEAAPGTALFDQFAARVRAFEQHRDDTAAGALRLVGDVRRQPPENLDDLVDQLQEVEERSARQLMPVLRDFKANRNIFARDPNPRFRLQATALLRRYEEAIVASLEALRDARWQLMAFRAEIEDQSGETFTDPQELLRHLRDL
jgi:predicted phage gp36 major capsid-like protein